MLHYRLTLLMSHALCYCPIFNRCYFFREKAALVLLCSVAAINIALKPHAVLTSQRYANVI